MVACFSTACGALMSTFMKMVYIEAPGISPFQFSHIRSMCSLFLCFSLIKQEGSSIIYSNKMTMQGLLIRGVVGSIASTLNSYAISMINLTKAVILYYSNPIFTILFSWLLLKESVSKYDMISLIVSFVGVVLICMSSPEETSN